jgi:hypothetical protein
MKYGTGPEHRTFKAEELLYAHMVKDTQVMLPHEHYVDEILPKLLPATHTFEVTTTPAGKAPEEIRRAWVGVHLPVRSFLPAPSSTVPILAVDGIVALGRAGKDEAKEWWTRFYDTDPGVNSYLIRGITPLINPFAKQRATMARLTFMGFDQSEGSLVELNRSLRHKSASFIANIFQKVR